MTQSLSKKIKAFYCHLCRSDKPSLKIKYKSKYNDFSKNLNKQRAQELSSTDSTFLKFYKETQVAFLLLKISINILFNFHKTKRLDSKKRLSFSKSLKNQTKINMFRKQNRNRRLQFHHYTKNQLKQKKTLRIMRV